MKLIFLTLALFVYVANGNYANILQDLKAKLFQNYDKDVRSISESHIVKFHMSPVCFIMDFDNGLIYGDMVTTYSWYDDRLRWNPDDHNGIDKFSVPSELVRIPDVVLFKSSHFLSLKPFPDRVPGESFRVIVNHDSVITYMPERRFEAYCENINKENPLEPQTCELQFGLWTMSENEYELQIDHSSEIDLQWYRNACPYKYIHGTVEKNIKLFDCCPDTPYGHISYNITIQNKFDTQQRVFPPNPKLKSD